MLPPTATIPEGLDLVTNGDGFAIRRVWLTWKIAFLGLFAIFWDSFLVFWYSHALSQRHPSLMMVVFPFFHVAAGLGITYYVIAALFNKTDVVISPTSVRVVTGPAPWFGNKDVPVGDIAAVMVRERLANRSKTYSVMYADRSRKERKLVTSLPQSDQAAFIAQTIRKTLGLSG